MSRSFASGTIVAVAHGRGIKVAKFLRVLDGGRKARVWLWNQSLRKWQARPSTFDAFAIREAPENWTATQQARANAWRIA